MNRSATRSAERAVPCLNSNNCIDTENPYILHSS